MYLEYLFDFFVLRVFKPCNFGFVRTFLTTFLPLLMSATSF